MVARVVAVGVPDPASSDARVRVAMHGAADRCPGALHAIAADDGALVRVRVPGGYLGATAMLALADIAERYGDGAIDLTARANVQLRGLRDDDLAAVARALEASELLPSASHERARNVAANPFAGVDPRESFDVRELVRALDRALVDDVSLAALPPKFLFAFDGGGYGADTRGADLVARAVTSRDGADAADGAPVAFALEIAGDARVLVVPAADVVAIMLALARHAIARAESAGLANTSWRLATFRRDVDRIPSELTTFVRDQSQTRLTCVETAKVSGSVDRAPLAPFGVVESFDIGHVSLVPTVPLGRLNVAQARTLVAVASETGADIRLAPWRGIVIGGVARAAVARTRDALDACGLPLEGGGFIGLAACAGRGACDASLADVRDDASTYAALVVTDDGSPVDRWRVNFAGCEKRCAMRRGADVDLVATSRGYDLWFRGARVATSLEPHAAIADALALRERHRRRDARDARAERDATDATDARNSRDGSDA